ncbi:MAG: RluA family pseudouridine synthase, partial [Acidimicrobiia bacterium]
PGIVHRLDKETSGLLVVAKTDAAYVQLIAAMKERKVARSYLALVLGRLDSTTGRIEAPIGRSAKDRVRMGVAGTRGAVTEFRMLRSVGTEASLLEVRLLTGRTHQIRVHMAHIGHPIVGDSSYGRKASSLAKAIGLSRPFLHASKLAFAHPITSEPVSVEEELPVELMSALERADRLAR